MGNFNREKEARKKKPMEMMYTQRLHIRDGHSRGNRQYVVEFMEIILYETEKTFKEKSN